METSVRPAPQMASLGEFNAAFKVLMESVSEALFVVDPRSLRFIDINQKAASLLGYSKPELLEAKIDRVFPSSSGVFNQHTPVSGEHLVETGRLVRRDGDVLCVELSIHTVEHAGGHAKLIVLHDRPGEPGPATQSNDSRATSPGHEDLIEMNLEFPSIIGQGPQVRDVCRLIGLVAKTDTTVLVQGESGTGKEVVGQAIHFHSHRARGPLITVNCAALTETLLESELFGHKKGSFTGAIQDRKGRFKMADGGTIILDEVGSMSMSGQAKLLRVLQEREFEPVGESLTVRVDVRVIAITNADLVRASDEGKFREDLYYRLNAFPICLPPLRERKTDIPLLVRHFLKRYTVSLRRQIKDIDLDAVQMLMDYSWPGNVRELENAIEYAVILEKGEVLRAASLPEKLRRENNQDRSLKHRLDLAERQIILEALSGADWVKNRAARLLGIDRRNLSYFLNKHGMSKSPGKA